MGFFKKKSPKVYPKKLVVGLGNPGPQYSHTRHNVGFDIIDLVAKRHGVKVNTGRRQALIAEVEILGVAVALVKPMTFMNLSGRAVKDLAAAYGIGPADILVVTDDLDLPTGTLKMKPKGSSGGHNGHKSIIASLGTDEYPRIKIGIGKSGETIDHVLGRFDPDERAAVERVFETAANGIESWLSDGLERAMNLVNQV
ncbi:MAG: aminoacyl-tRNA hydrolase [Armatimonadetes bacterium]|nr:aminoacyl-tRNA hydrolase [Armatimonadota bacterium]MBS1711313.1 aminoacyl-tRNA hydrolase [Armatimonadota bacterium]MBX3107762.1 aminoacyl-tRNA hydrolase [Fimbriimonadaceae bacterium]